MINTGIPASLVPQTLHNFVYSYANRSLISLPLRIALIGAGKGGTAVNGQVYEIADAGQTDALFGLGTELSLMCRMAYACSGLLRRGPRVFAVQIAESAGLASVNTYTVTGPATADGPVSGAVAGRKWSVGVRSGDAQNTIATAIANALKAQLANLPVDVSVAANVITLTHRTKGVNGQDVKVTVDQLVPGVGVAVANTVVGTQATDHQPALDALQALDYDAIVFANHAAADITEVTTDSAIRWNPANKRWAYYFLAEMGTIGTATALAAAANTRACVIGSYEGCPNTAGEIATALAFLAFSRARPNATYNGARVPLYPPPAGTVYTPTERETAIAAGLTPLAAMIDSTGSIVPAFSQVVRMVTTKTTEGGQPFGVLRDLAVSRTGVYYAKQLDAATAARFSEDAEPDGVLQTDTTIEQDKDIARGVARAMGEANILRDVEQDLAKMQAERDAETSGRTNAELFYTVVVGQHQIAWKHNVQI